MGHWWTQFGRGMLFFVVAIYLGMRGEYFSAFAVAALLSLVAVIPFAKCTAKVFGDEDVPAVLWFLPLGSMLLSGLWCLWSIYLALLSISVSIT